MSSLDSDFDAPQSDDQRSSPTRRNECDERGRHHVAQQASSRLQKAHLQLSPQRVRCECEGATLRLEGRVPTYYLKQLAQSLAATVDGVERIDNRLDVDPPPWAA